MKIVPQAPSQSKPDAFQEMIGQMQGFIRQAAEHRCAAHEVEQELFKQLLQLGLLLLKEFFARLGTGDEGEQVEVAGIGRLKRSPTLHSRRYQSIFGEVVLERWVYSRGQKRRVEYAAVDAQAGLPAGKFSYLLQDWAQRLAVECSFAQVKTFLHRLLGVELPVASLEQMNQALSQEVEGFWQALEPVPPATGQAVVVLSGDGKGVPMRKAPDSTPQSLSPNHYGPQPGRKKMALVGSVYTVAPYIRTPLEVVEALFAGSQTPRPADGPARPQPEHKRVRAALSEAPAGQSGHSAQVIFPWLRDELLARDPQHTQAHVVVMDGQQTLWDELETALQGQARVEVLDLLHAAGYLWKAVHLFHKPASPSAQALMKLCLLALLEGQVKKLMAWLSDQAQQVSLCAQAREQLASIGAYFHRHRHRVQYDQYLAKGYPIASGVIEGACRHVVKDRLERTGMNWTLPGAQAMLALRCVAINDQWEAFMTHRIAQETARLYPYASQNRPDPQPFLQAA